MLAVVCTHLKNLNRKKKTQIKHSFSAIFSSSIFSSSILLFTVFKRSADISNEGKFAEYAGRGVEEINIVNINRVAKYEAKN